jgi:hypothetical protein
MFMQSMLRSSAIRTSGRAVSGAALPGDAQALQYKKSPRFNSHEVGIGKGERGFIDMMRQH